MTVHETIENLKDYLVVDEDASNGEASEDTAPWLGVNASVPSGDYIVIFEPSTTGRAILRTWLVEMSTTPAPTPTTGWLTEVAAIGWQCDPDAINDNPTMMGIPTRSLVLPMSYTPRTRRTATLR